MWNQLLMKFIISSSKNFCYRCYSRHFVTINNLNFWSAIMQTFFYFHLYKLKIYYERLKGYNLFMQNSFSLSRRDSSSQYCIITIVFFIANSVIVYFILACNHRFSREKRNNTTFLWMAFGLLSFPENDVSMKLTKIV